MKHFELVENANRRTPLLQRTSVRRLVTSVAILSSVAFASSSHRAIATELPDAGTSPTTILPPAPTPPVVVTPTEDGGTATVHLGGNGGTVTVGTHDGNWNIHGDIGDPFGERFHLTADLDSADWRINGGLGIGGGVTVGTGTGGTTIGIGSPLGGNGGNGTLTTGPGGTTGTIIQPVGSVNGNAIDLTLTGTLNGPNGNGVYIGIGTGLGPQA